MIKLLLKNSTSRTYQLNEEVEKKILNAWKVMKDEKQYRKKVFVFKTVNETEKFYICEIENCFQIEECAFVTETNS